ncbi:sugar phosphate isomerase/epimerase and 4-hydroxyphenylpyruvate domain-containing protein [Kineococcus indalonis]|uniref:sugar phosphate isomerase/epimerase and 4-hydroxyphenylpyruvate domain-containing protein n=1 Tax=Kineococcus indalonis TaxID=2696566 RepID=UPI0014136282|nr:sugar phosphate isomerase/epimerase and 4-hydroxyphenylpyruvate domain-containing protein [Kineococcus indalonis]NAZ87118.1 TIM barrel protein [Kineococcus indalonis]
MGTAVGTAVGPRGRAAADGRAPAAGDGGTHELRTSIATVCLAGTLDEKLRAVAAAGFDAVEVFEPDLLASPERPAALRRRVEDLGLSVSLFQPFRDVDDVDPAAVARTAHRLHRKCELALELGTGLVLVCSAVHAGAVRDDALLAAQLHAAAEVAASHGVRLAYEALAWGAHVSDYRHAARLVAAADHPALGNCLDSFHVLSRGDDPADIAAIPAKDVFFYQIADAPRLPMDVLPLSRHHRCFPGQGEFDLERFHAAVVSSGYRGPVSLEVFNDLFRQADPAATAVDAMRSLRHLRDRTFRHRPGLPPASPSPSLPEPPAVREWAFTEVSASPATAPAVTGVLSQLGFSRTGEHRSGPVELWSNGAARVVLNRRREDVRAEVSALGLATPQPHALHERARTLLAPVVNRAVGPGEAEIPSVLAPDGTWVQFCGDAPAGGGWLADFTRCGPEPAGAAREPVPLDGVDHVVLPQPFAGFDAATLFLSSVLGLEAEPVSVVPGPAGLVRTRTLTSPHGRVRIAVSVAPTSSILRGRPVGAGHVAFSTPDALAAAAAFRRNGGELLPVPANYYDDLEARYGLGAGLLASLRENDVMYDRDEHGGELLHFTTRSLSRELFVEVLQRTGGYGGYGEVNAPVRLAAQSAPPTP